MNRSRGDEKMEDVSRQIGELREEMREGFRDVRSEIKDVRSEIKDVRSEFGLRFDSLHASINTLWASMIGGYVALLVAFVLTRS
jgi:division protein CdvB (Snf7/Vps24/ESCRT-III family)